MQKDFYQKNPKPLLNNLTTPAYNIAQTDEEYSLMSGVATVQEESKIQDF